MGRVEGIVCAVELSRVAGGADLGEMGGGETCVRK